MSFENSFNLYTGELQTGILTYPLRFTFDGTSYKPFLSAWNMDLKGQFTPKLFLQGGPGLSIYAAARRNNGINGSLTMPLRITKGKELETIVVALLKSCFFNQNCSLSPKFFQIETGYFKTANGWMTKPGKSDEPEWNEDFFLLKATHCLTSKFSIKSSANNTTNLDISFEGTIQKSVLSSLFDATSGLTSVTTTFDPDRVLGFQDTKVFLNDSIVPNCVSAEFTIERKIVKQDFLRSVDKTLLGTQQTINNFNDLPSKIGIEDFNVFITIKQVLRRIDEDLYFSRGGKGVAKYSGDFIEIWFGPIQISRPCALVQQAEQPFSSGIVERTTTFLLLNRPRPVSTENIDTVNKTLFSSDFANVHYGGLW